MHLAFASAYHIDFLVTCSFKHLANAFVWRRVREIRANTGLFVPIICTREEMLGE